MSTGMTTRQHDAEQRYRDRVARVVAALVGDLYHAAVALDGDAPEDRPVIEVYHSPFDTPPHELRTDLLIPIRDLD
jgi:DNA gyrase inhibitor GyrI